VGTGQKPPHMETILLHFFPHLAVQKSEMCAKIQIGFELNYRGTMN